MRTKQLTDKQRNVLEFIKAHIVEYGYPPTIREICKQFGFASPLSAKQHVDALERKGYVRRAPSKQRAIELITTQDTVLFPLVGEVRAGKPVWATEKIEDYIPLERNVFKTDNGFALRVVGDSMTGAGIFEGDILFVDPQRRVEDGDIVVALIEDEATVKRFYRDGDNVRLVPENSHMQPIVAHASGVHIVGKVLGILRKF